MLVVGLSSGSWVEFLTHFPKVKKIDVVEIDRGYLDVIKSYPQHRKILDHDTVKIHIDDGRRWMTRNSDRKFDFILMNTTWHWRSMITNLLSKEFMELCRSRLNPGGVLYLNTTGSEDVFYTGAKTFKYMAKYWGFIALSDRPFDMTLDERREALLSFKQDGKPIYDMSNPKHVLSLKKMTSGLSLENLAQEYLSRTDLNVIRDDNMMTEYRKSKIYNENLSWKKLLPKIAQRL